MTVLVKDGIRMAVRDGNHLAAFLNNGWKVADSQKAEKPEENAVKQYSKSDISRMSTADLKTLAPTLEIEVTEESTGAKLKEEIVAKLGL